MKVIKDYSLYLVASQEYAGGREIFDVAKEAVEGGVDILQMREKQKPREELVKLGVRLAGLCGKSGVTFIVNDDPYLAGEIGADGVHLGQEDLKKHPLSETRRVLGKGKMIGVSTHSYEEFKGANGADFDYIAFGPIFPTKTKDYFIGD